MNFNAVYFPVGVPTYHLETAQDQFERSCAMLRAVDPDFICPDEMLLGLDKLREFIEGKNPDLVVFQNLTFANAAFMSQVLRRFDCPVLLWTLREPVIDGGRLRLNSLTGAYSAANALAAFDGKPFHWCFGAPEEESVISAVKAAYGAAKLKKAMRSLTVASIGPRELIERAKGYSDEECAEYLRETECCTAGFEKTPEKNQLDHARLLKAYSDYVKENHIGALSSRCWPDFFTSFGTPVCTVLSMLNDAGVAAACEADAYGALSMWMGMQLSGEAVFFGDPVALDENESSITYWHCGMAACSLARRDTGAVVGVHPNRKIGPAMDFGCEAFADATVFRIGRKPDGSFRFFIAEGSVLDKPKQFIGTSIVVKTDKPSREVVEDSIRAGFEPHFVVIKGRHAETLSVLAKQFGFEVCRY